MYVNHADIIRSQVLYWSQIAGGLSDSPLITKDRWTENTAGSRGSPLLPSTDLFKNSHDGPER